MNLVYDFPSVFKLYPLKDPHKVFEIENISKGQIQGHQNGANIWFYINVQ